MTEPLRFRGLFAVALPTGERAHLIPGASIDTHLGWIPRPDTAAGLRFDLLWLDITNVGGFQIAGQAQAEPGDAHRGTWHWRAGIWTHVSTDAPGTYPVIFDAQGQVRIATPEGNGSQGWRYVAEDGTLVTGDDTYNDERRIGRESGIHGLWEYTYLGGLVIGQGETGCDVVDPTTQEHRRLETGDTRFIRVRHAAGIFAIAYTNLALGEVVYIWRTRAELLALPLVTAPTPPTPNPEPPPMSIPLPDDVLATRARYVARFPIPQLYDAGSAHEERCRQWSIKFAEQVAFEHPGDGWGMKRADPTRPISKDTISREQAGRLLTWDLLIGTGTGSPVLAENPMSQDVTGQTFVPVTPTDHLGGVPTPAPTPTPSPSPCTCKAELAALLVRLEAAEDSVVTARSEADAAQRTADRALALAQQEHPLPALKVVGTIGRTFSHAHSFTGTVTKA